jgi:uncharacterized membrane protein YphA (DoxX/SURF4 family)
LRLAVAGILGVAAFKNLAYSDRPIEIETVPTLEGPASAADAIDTAESVDLDPTPMDVSTEAGVGVVDTSTPVVRVEEPVSVYPSQIFLGLTQGGMALLLFFGLFTRLAGLVGAAVIGAVALIAHGLIVWPNFGEVAVEKLVNMYDSNATAFLLLGAICLSLLVSGSGPLALDRLIFGRRRVAQTVEPTTTQTSLR